MKKNNFCVIMAGGVGSRFWPVSKTKKPKQFLDILGIGRTLIQQTYDRFINICEPENILIVTSQIYKDLVIEQLPDLPVNNILLEPERRNTAPCIAYANYKIEAKNPNANIIVTPADHLVLDTENFTKIINKSLEYTAKNDDLLTLGIKPNRPETGYGYIQICSDCIYDKISNTNIKKVKTFTEKPELKMAKVFYESGEFLWNSGIFIWSLKAIKKAFQSQLKSVDGLFKQGIGIYNTENESLFITRTYKKCKSVSIDYGIMENAKNVFVYPVNFGWSDLGTWSSLYENSKKDSNGNVKKGDNILLYKTKNSIINVSNDKLVVIQGLKDIIVAESDNVLLISTKKDEQEIRQIVNDVRIEKGEKYI